MYVSVCVCVQVFKLLIRRVSSSSPSEWKLALFNVKKEPKKQVGELQKESSSVASCADVGRQASLNLLAQLYMQPNTFPPVVRQTKLSQVRPVKGGKRILLAVRRMRSRIVEIEFSSSLVLCKYVRKRL